MLELFDYTRQIRDALDLEARALVGHAHREHVHNSDTKNSEGSGERDGVEFVSHASESHTSS